MFCRCGTSHSTHMARRRSWRWQLVPLASLESQNRVTHCPCCPVNPESFQSMKCFCFTPALLLSRGLQQQHLSCSPWMEAGAKQRCGMQQELL